jgi:hypothetical protein
VPTGTLLEACAEHPDALQSITAAEVGFKGANLDVFSNVIRIWDDPVLNVFSLSTASPSDGSSGSVFSGFDFTNYPPNLSQIYRVYRSSLDTAEFQIDDSDFDVLSGAYVPTGQMYGWLMSYAQPPAMQSRFVVDWLRIRKWCGADALATPSGEEPYAIGVVIDIKPGSDPNSINLRSRGVTPVAILSTADFDAMTVDPTSTVTFAGASYVRWVLEDVDHDDDVDMLFHFRTQELNLDDGSSEACLTGETDAGRPISGCDNVNIVPKGPAKGHNK